MPLSKKLTAEFVGTFWLILGGCGSAVLAAAFSQLGIGLPGVSLDFWFDRRDHGVRHWPRINAPSRFAPLAIGLALTLIHLISIPITNTSVNPARSTGPAIFVQGWALSQLWLFWVAPLVGAAIGALVYRFIASDVISEFAPLVLASRWCFCLILAPPLCSRQLPAI